MSWGGGGSEAGMGRCGLFKLNLGVGRYHFIQAGLVYPKGSTRVF